MKKYVQIGVVLGFFGLLVLVRQLHGNNDAAPVVGNNSASSESTNPQTNTSQQITPSASSGKYKDGTYTGDVTDAFYGNVQVQVTISNGKISDVQFLDYPHDAGTSREINSQAMPLLRQEAITAQSAQVDIVSGASQTSQAFQQSLSSALQKAS